MCVFINGRQKVKKKKGAENRGKDDNNIGHKNP